jgi:hypothetical protein
MKTLREYINLVNEADGVTNPWPAGTPHATAWDTMSPEDKKWLGGADPTDKYILARAPNKGKPVAQPAAPAAPAAVATPVAEPTPSVATPLPAAPQQAANPNPPTTPTAPVVKPPPGAPNPVMTLQNKLIGLGAKITADGIMGPKTKAAMKEYGLDANGNPVKDAKTGQPVTNDKTANAIIQRGGVDPKEITKDMTVAQQVRSDLEAQRANTMTPTGAPTTKNAKGQEVYTTQSGKEVVVGSLTDKRNQRQAEYQAQNQAFLAQQAAKKAGTTPPAATGQGPKPATPPARSAPPISANSTTLPDGTPIERSQGNSSPEYMNQFGGSAPNQGSTAPAAGSVPPAPNQGSTAPAAGSVPPAPVNPKEKAAWARQYGGKYDPKTGAPLSEGTSYNELGRIISLVHYR